MNIFGPFEQIFISPDIFKSVKYKLHILFIKPPSHHFCNKIKHLCLKSLKFENNYRPMSPPTFRMMKSIPSPVSPSPVCHSVVCYHLFSSLRPAQLSLPVLSIRCSGHNWLTLTPLMLYADRTVHCTAAHITALYSELYTQSGDMRYFYPCQNCLQIKTNHNVIMALCFSHTRMYV